MPVFDKPPRYQTFLLTFWEERSSKPEDRVIWRFSLEDPQTGQRRGFANLEMLMAALWQLMADAGEEGSGEGPTSVKYGQNRRRDDD